jgi:hypothetical protein
MMGMLSPSIAYVYVNSIEKWDDHSLQAGENVILAVAFHRGLFCSPVYRSPISLKWRSFLHMQYHSYPIIASARCFDGRPEGGSRELAV